MKNIGQKIRLLRQKKNLALKDLAEKTGLSSSFLSQLEKGLTLPSVDSLRKIAHALCTTVGNFFDETESKEFVFIKHQQKNPPDPISNYEILASSVLDIGMLPMMLRLKPKEVLTADKCPQGEEMLAVIVKGEIVVRVNEKEFKQTAGDSLYLVRPRFQSIENGGQKDAAVLWTILRQNG
ncbi:MAG: helix-turn-helix domain-containing protein [Candidatus Omnitrophica bacterium]|nr:helix-turn-helix domain-containing protein [Candidatus Omnitrophota bacterium]